MSKFNNLLQTIPCEWVCPMTGEVCEETFDNMDNFLTHLREQHLLSSPSNASLPSPAPDPGPPDTMGACQWCDCEFKTLSSTSKEFKVHVLFHAYHSYLKLLGKEFQARLDLPACLVDSDLANTLPLIEVDLKCLWYDGGCGAEFDCVSGLYRHVHRHAQDNTTGDCICSWQGCSHKCRDRGKLLEHVRVHLAEKVVACPTCGSLFSNTTKLKDHLNRQSTNLTHTCSYCHKSFANERLLREHTRRHVNTIKCPHCDLTCQSPSRLMEHIRYRHVDTRPHECPLCHKTFKTTHTLVDHLETHRDKCYHCTEPDCYYVTKAARNFSYHMRTTHKGQQLLYCCHICNMRYAIGRKLTQHLKNDHGFELPPGHCRFRYIAGLDGLKRLQTVRLDDEALITPEMNVYQPSNEVQAPPISPPSASTSQLHEQPQQPDSTSFPEVNDISIMSSLLDQLQNST